MIEKSFLFLFRKPAMCNVFGYILTNVTKIKHVEIEQYQKTLYIQER